jgi:DNA topoisomerase-2
VGSISAVEDSMWILNDNAMVYEKIKYVPGLYKIFDEVLVNAADNYQRDHRMTKIEVTIEKNGTITVLNDGKGIPVQIHK